MPPEDAELLIGKGVAAVYTPKDFDITRIMRDIVALLEASANGRAASEPGPVAVGADGA